jgi:epoxyqueuosine reductase
LPRKIPTFVAPVEIMEQFPPGVSGNAINGLGETAARRPSTFLWHMPDQSPLGRLREYVLENFFSFPETVKAFWEPDGGRGPEPIAVAPEQQPGSAEAWTEKVKAFSLAHEADDVGITAVNPLHIYEGFEEKLPHVILLAVAHDYDLIATAPSDPYDLTAGCELGTQYARAARVSAELTNFIRAQGYQAEVYQGPDAHALAFLPHAIAAGLGELGKHGSLIHHKFGAAFRLAAVTTDVPLVYDAAHVFGAVDFCAKCQVCTDACPPEAIKDHKQWVRGTEKWYVDFDKCIPYFNETIGCGICIAVCPWTRPGVADSLVAKMAKRRLAKS